MIQILENNRPLEDFHGLSPNEVHRLIYDPYGRDSPVFVVEKVHSDILDRVPFFRLTEEFLRILNRDRSIRLTAKGALPRRILHELYSLKLIPEAFVESGISKLSREIDSRVLTTLRVNTTLTGLVRKMYGKLFLTELGERLTLTDDRWELFRLILKTFTEKFNWAYNDRYPQESVGQFGWCYTVYLLLRFGNETHEGQFYADEYLLAFPEFLAMFRQWKYGNPNGDFTNCYFLRTFEQFFEWFGFVVLDGEKPVINGKSTVRRTQALTEMFQLAS